MCPVNRGTAGLVHIALALALALAPAAGCGSGNPFGGAAQMDDDSALSDCGEDGCGSNASCSDDGECACDDGFEGDPDEGCVPVGDDDSAGS